MHSSAKDLRAPERNGQLPHAAPALAAPETETPPIPPLLVTSRDAARMLCVSERTLWGLTARGGVPCVRLGRAVRYAVADLAAYVERLRGDRGPLEGGRA